MAWVYILQSLKNNSYYIGSTDNLERRLYEHNHGQTRYTKHLMPLKLLFQYECSNILTSHQIELKLKRMKSRKIIEDIIKSGQIKFLQK